MTTNRFGGCGGDDEPNDAKRFLQDQSIQLGPCAPHSQSSYRRCHRRRNEDGGDVDANRPIGSPDCGGLLRDEIGILLRQLDTDRAADSETTATFAAAAGW